MKICLILQRGLKHLGPFFMFILIVTQLGCATYQGNVNSARNLIEDGRFEEAIQTLKPLAETPSDDQLVYLMDYGMALHLAGRYQESIEVFIKADKIADIQDYHSISNVASSMAFSAEMVQYKGEDYEKVLINAFLALNFLSLQNLESALVEVRRINQKLYRFKHEGGRNYEQNSFAAYVSAIIWESDKKYDDAFIAYKNSYEIDPNIPGIKNDLIRSAKLASRLDEYQKYKKMFPEVEENSNWYNKKQSEIILIMSIGWGPRKYPNPNSPRFPKLYPVHSSTRFAKIFLNDTQTFETKHIYDVEKTAMKVFDEAYGALVMSRVGGIATKAVLSDQIRQKNEALGHLSWIVMNATDRADLRQWSTLPQTIQIARIPVTPGQHSLRVEALGDGAYPLQNQKFDVEVKPGQKYFINWRSLK